jgi:hypothetical protein
MSKKTIEFRDPVVQNVVEEFVRRSDVGFKKYGQTLHNERTTRQKDLATYLKDVQEELMDAILYIQAAREEIQDLKEEHLLSKMDEISYDESHDGYMLDNDEIWGES